jgi:hypothetical protein
MKGKARFNSWQGQRLFLLHNIETELFVDQAAGK